LNHAERQPRKLGWRFVLLAVLVVVVITAVIRSCWLDVYYIPSDSMDPLLKTGDRVLVSRTAYAAAPVRRGDVVVFDGRGSFAPLQSGRGPVADAAQTVGEWLGIAGSDTVYVKRVLGVAGDHVHCCAPDGRLEINGVPVREGYLYPGDAPSEMRFDVVVPPGKLWLMGDHRSVSADSRSLLGAPGGGLVSTGKVIGRPIRTLWPVQRIRSLPRTALLPASPPPATQKDAH